VEDDLATYTALKGILTLRGWDVTVATTLEQAKIAIDAAKDLNTVILDLMLPDGEGEDLLQELKTRPSQTMIVVTTGVDDAQRIADVEKLAPNVLLRKPIALAELLGAITPKAA